MRRLADAGLELPRERLRRLLDRDVAIHCDEEAMVLMLTGEPIDEPVVGQGPFVMNTQEEIRQAIRDFQSGRMGQLTVQGASD